MRTVFFQGAQELLLALNEQGLALEKDPANVEALREIRRVVHTLKGDSAACGFRELSDLAHELEDVLTPEIANGNASSLAELVLSSADMFDAMCAAYRARMEPPSGDPLRSLIWRMAQKTPASKSSDVAVKPAFAWTEYERLAMSDAAGRGLHVFEIAVTLAADCPMRAAGIALLKKVLDEAGTVLACSPESAKWAQAGHVEFAVASERDLAWVKNKCNVPGVAGDVAIEPLAPALEADPGPAGATAVVATTVNDASANAAANRVLAASDNTLRVDAERVDHLLNLVGELVIGKSMLHQFLHDFTKRSPKDPLRIKFADALAFHSQVLNALQRSAMKIRMVRVEQLFRRFPRLVRDVARMCGKDVQLEMSGQETELDKGLLDSIAEPLIHMVRNAVDHGIETPAERRAAGKPEQGTIRLHAHHEGNQVVVRVSDDGHGIDSGKVLAKAMSRGLINPEQSAQLTQTETLDFIFDPGFSTAERVSELSGRGVGLDVVKTAVQRLKGTVAIETQPGHGTAFQLSMPLTLAIIRAMLFRVADRLYAIPLDSVLEIKRAKETDIQRVADHQVLQIREEVLTLVRLNQLAPAPPQSDGEGKIFVIVVSEAGRKFGLIVDKLVGEDELVIKPLDESVINTDLVSGASVLGDGTVVLILNLGEVLRKFARVPAAIATAATGGDRPLGARA